MKSQIRIKPQSGPQTEFLKSRANIVIFGGSAGGGKTVALLLEPLRHLWNKKFQATIFRRTTKQIYIQGGLWDTAMKLFEPLEPTPRLGSNTFLFREGLELTFSHIELESDIYNYQGASIPYIGFDEIDHFTLKQFEYMLSRNRSDSGISGYIRGTCNPNPESWVRKWVDWYIGEDGYAIPERSGVIRYFVRPDNDLVWFNSIEECKKEYPHLPPKSFTFIRSSLYDNKILMQNDPNYETNLLALPRVERERLLLGNWNIKTGSGIYFKKEYFEIIDILPANPLKIIRYWDRASTKPNDSNPDPDYTVGLKLYYYANGLFVVGDIRRIRNTPMEVEKIIYNTAKQDEPYTETWIEQDPGQAGVADADNYVRLLVGHHVKVNRVTKDKKTRALPSSAQAERGNVKLLKANWNDAFLYELENFDGSGKGHDDQVDSFSGALNQCVTSPSTLDVL